MNFEEKAVDRIKKLEREVERLRVKESPGAWAAWTPTYSQAVLVTAGGGTAYFRYSVIGKTVFIDIRIWNCTLSSAGTYIGISLPVAPRTASSSTALIDVNAVVSRASVSNGVLGVYRTYGYGGWNGSETSIDISVRMTYEAA